MNTLNFVTETNNINGHGHTQMHTDIQSEHKSSKYREAMTPFYRASRSTKNVCVSLCGSVANRK